MIDSSGKDVTEFFENGITEIRKRLEGQNIKQVILQSRSFSCGVNQIYDGSFSGVVILGRGMLAQKLMDLGYEVLDAEDI